MRPTGPAPNGPWRSKKPPSGRSGSGPVRLGARTNRSVGGATTPSRAAATTRAVSGGRWATTRRPRSAERHDPNRRYRAMSRLTDEQAAEAIAAHHVELSGEIRRRAEILAAAVRAGEPFEDARIDVLDYLDRELLPHAAAEERALYPAADRAATALLVRA